MATAAATSQVPADKAWIRSIYPNVKWNPGGVISNLPGGKSLQPGQYDLVGGKSYVDPNAMAGLYQEDTAPRPITQEGVDAKTSTLEQMYNPMYTRRADALSRAIDRIGKQSESMRGLAEVAYADSQASLQRQEGKEYDRARKSSISRGTYTSGVYDHAQHQIAGDYAPEYASLEKNKAANLAKIAGDAALAIDEYAAQGKDLEAEYMTKVFEGAMGVLQKEEDDRKNYAKDQVAFLLGLGNQQYNRNRDTVADTQWAAGNKIAQQNADTSRMNAVTTQTNANKPAAAPQPSATSLKNNAKNDLATVIMGYKNNGATFEDVIDGLYESAGNLGENISIQEAIAVAESVFRKKWEAEDGTGDPIADLRNALGKGSSTPATSTPAGKGAADSISSSALSSRPLWQKIADLLPGKQYRP